jgi:hypothetical protein
VTRYFSVAWYAAVTNGGIERWNGGSRVESVSTLDENTHAFAAVLINSSATARSISQSEAKTATHAAKTTDAGRTRAIRAWMSSTEGRKRIEVAVKILSRVLG